MDRKIGQNPEVLESIQKKIAVAEKERKKARFAFNLKGFEQGNSQILKNSEFIAGLEEFFATLPVEEIDKKTQLLNKLGDAALSENLQIRERALALLSSVTESTLEQNDRINLCILAKIFCEWLEFEEQMLPGYPVLIKRIEQILLWLLERSAWLEAEEVIALLQGIQSGKLEKSKAVKSLIGKNLNNLNKKTILEKLTDEYLLENDQINRIKNILHSLGPKAVVYLLNRVIHSYSRQERIILIDLIPTFGSVAVKPLAECLENNPPWAVVRNVIYIISEMDMDAHFSLVEEYFNYPDERVQHELIRCVLKLGGEHLKARLLEGLRLVSDRLKIAIIRLLVEHVHEDEKVAQALLELAVKKAIFSKDSRHDLLIAIIAALKTFPTQKGVEQLKKIHADYSEKVGSEHLLLQIEEALKVIEPKLRHSLQHVENFQELVSFDNDPVQQQLASEKVRKTEKEIQVLLSKGETEKAGKLICDQAMAAAKIKDFFVAESLRDRLLEIDSTAFSEVIKLGDFIEEQKSTSITSHHLEIWSELYEEMTTDEFNKLYYSLQQENYDEGEIVVKSGETDSSLYFLNSGYMSLSCSARGKEVFLKRLQPSFVLGGEQFFTHSVWTVTLKALTEIQVHVLDRQIFNTIIKEYPRIDGILRKYCERHVQVPELLKMSGEERRENLRHHVELNIKYVLLDPFGNKGKKSFSGKIFDISKQGLAFSIRISNIDNAKLLLGRHIITTIICDEQLLPQQYGVIVGVREHDVAKLDYSIHVKLSKKIDNDIFEKIISSKS